MGEGSGGEGSANGFIGQNCKKAVVNIQLHCTFVAMATPFKLLGIYLGTRLAHPDIRTAGHSII